MKTKPSLRLNLQLSMTFVALTLILIGLPNNASAYATPNLSSVAYTGNPFAVSSASLVGQCTWYCYGRIQEVGLKTASQLSSLPNRNGGTGVFLSNASTWVADAIAAGIPTGSTPQVGALAVWTGSQNHVAFVEGVSGNTITVTECNNTPVAGANVVVGGTYARLRSTTDASSSANIVWTMPQFTVMSALSGPSSVVNGYKWVQLTGNGYTGYVAWLDLVPSQPATQTSIQWNITQFQNTSGPVWITSASPTYIYLGSPADTTAPTISKFSVTPTSVTAGNSFSMSYTVSDSGGSGLNRVVLRRTSGNGTANDLGWHDIQTNTATGNGPVNGNFTDTPSAGTYWYGMAVFDGAGNSLDERAAGLGPVQRSVTTPVSAINLVTPSPASGGNATTGQALGLGVTVSYTVITAGYLQVWVYDNGFVTSVMNGTAINSAQSSSVVINLSLPSSATGQHNYNIYTQFRPGASGGPLLSDGINDVINSSSYKVNWQDPLPDAPTATAATSVKSGGFTANWQSVPGVAGYRGDISTSSSFNSFIPDYQDVDFGNTLGTSVTGLNANTPFYYRVRAYNATGASANSGTITVTTLPNPPSAPIASAATGLTSSSFTANWAIADGASGYILDISPSSAFNSFVTGFQGLSLNSLSQSMSGLSPNTPYYYRVRAYNSGGTSANSATITATTTGGGGAASPTISSPNLTGTTFSMTVHTQVGYNYTLEYKNAISDANWIIVQTVTGTGGDVTLTDTGATSVSRLYRVQIQ